VKAKNWLHKFGLLLLVLLLVVAVGCSGGNNKKEPANNSGSANNETPITPEEVTGPVEGGVLKVIQMSGPIVMSWTPDFGPSDYAYAMIGAEPLLAVASDRTLEGVLAESFEEDPEGKTITFYLRKGVKFHDGSDFNADVVLWNAEIGRKYSRIPSTDIDYVEKVDDYTVRYHLNNWTNQMLEGIGIGLQFSQAAFEANGGEEGGGIEWARANLSGTGPFKLVTYNRDNNMIWEKNENYWGEGPYLDGIEIVFIPEATTAMAKMEAGEAHMWSGAQPQHMKELEEKGFVRQYGWAGIQYMIVPNTVDADSPFVDKRVREAVEYAIDKQALCDALGYGYTEPLYTVAPQGDWGGDKIFREYDPDKARQLLAEAGYADGLKISLMASAGSGGRNETAEAIANMLNAVGFQVELDIADTGRFNGAVFGTNGWKDLILGYAGQDATYLTSVTRWWGHQAVAYPSMHKPEEFLKMCEESIKKVTREEQKQITEEIVYFMAEEAMVIPLTNAKTAFMRVPGLHTDYLEQGMTRWRTHAMWLDPEYH